MKSVKKWWIAGVFLIGIACLGKGYYMPAKAHLAQFLIARSWSENTQHLENARPWPWADISPIAKMDVPRLKVTQYIMQNASGEALAFGAGMLGQGVMPGDVGHSVIAGHRDSHFEFLQKVKQGDVIMVSNRKGHHERYKVSAMWVADSSKAPLQIAQNGNYLTLITCYPFNALVPGGPLRYVVKAEAMENKL